MNALLEAGAWGVPKNKLLKQRHTEIDLSPIGLEFDIL